MFIRTLNLNKNDNNKMSSFSNRSTTGKTKNFSSSSSSTYQHCLSPYSGNIYRPLFLLALLLLGLLNFCHALDTFTAPPPPLAAALASPGGSSILEQFSPNCTAVAHIFQSRGIDPAEIPQKPSNGK